MSDEQRRIIMVSLAGFELEPGERATIRPLLLQMIRDFDPTLIKPSAASSVQEDSPKPTGLPSSFGRELGLLAVIPVNAAEHAAIASAINLYAADKPMLRSQCHVWLDSAAKVLRESKAQPLDLRTMSPLTPQATVFKQIAVERERQDRQWGGHDHDDEHERPHWLNFIDEHKARAKKAISRQTGQREARPDLDEYRKQLVEIAALAIAAIESHDRKSLDARAAQPRSK